MSYADVRAGRIAALDKVGDLKMVSDAANDELNLAIQDAIDKGVTFTDLGEVLNLSEAAIRQKSNRRGWHEAGSRRSR